jgi:cobyrinic acid a,c-diamide synthase
VAALVLGCQRLDQAVPIKAIILNNLAHSRHEGTIKKSIKRYCHLPVLGAMPRLKNLTFPGRHLGLVPPQEHLMAEKAIMAATKIVKKYLDTKKLWQIALEAPCLDVGLKKHPTSKKTKVNIGIIRDAAFQFYYPENIEALDRLGAKIVEFSALKDGLPAGLDGLYIGGGFPETQASTLAANEGLKLAIKNAAQRGLPIYAECGGLMYLSKNLIWQGKDYPLVGIFPLSIGVGKKPKGHGYTILKVECPNPFFKVGQILRGHEFHYSYILKSNDDKGVYFIFMVRRGYGMDGKHDGLCYRNVLATYTHLHALGEPNWARALIKQALVYKRLVS